jgi:hypothetical protein
MRTGLFRMTLMGLPLTAATLAAPAQRWSACAPAECPCAPAGPLQSRLLMPAARVRRAGRPQAEGRVRAGSP